MAWDELGRRGCQVPVAAARKCLPRVSFLCIRSHGPWNGIRRVYWVLEANRLGRIQQRFCGHQARLAGWLEAVEGV